MIVLSEDLSNYNFIPVLFMINTIIRFSILMSLGWSSLGISYAQSSERPIRMGLGFFSAVNTSIQEKARLRKNVESAIIQTMMQCPDYLEFVPENVNQASVYFDNQNYQYARDYKQTEGVIPVPAKVNYVVSIGLDINAEYGPQLILDVYIAEGKNLRFLTRGEATSDFVWRKLSEPSSLKAFAEEAVANTLLPNHFRKWLEDSGIPSSEYANCFRTDSNGSLLYDFAISCTSAARVAIDGKEVNLSGGMRGYLQFAVTPGEHTISVWDEYGEVILESKTIEVTQDCLTLRGCSSGIVTMRRAPGCEE